MPGKHSRPHDGGRAYWLSERLWKLAENLPVQRIRLDTIEEFDQNCWFGSHYSPTCRDVAKHAKRIMDADLSFPIILASDGSLMDGGHRIAKAWIEGLEEIDAVRFPVNPDPDYIVPLTEGENEQQ